MRNPKIKLISDHKLRSIVSCNLCGKKIKYAESYSFVDGNNIAITNNAKPYCGDCWVIIKSHSYEIKRQLNKTAVKDFPILIKTEVPTCSCTGCFYHTDGEPCSRPTESKQKGYTQPDCSEGDGAYAKYYIFVEQPKTK